MAGRATPTLLSGSPSCGRREVMELRLKIVVTTPKKATRCSGCVRSPRPSPEQVLDDVCFDLHRGEVLAVVGQNGSGKSTLVKVLAGIHQADPGGEIDFSAVGRSSRREQLHFIHQDLGLIEPLSTTENLDLSRRLGVRDLLPGGRRGEHERAAVLVRRAGATIDVRSPIARLSPAERAIVALARAMDGWPRPDGVLYTRRTHRELPFQGDRASLRCDPSRP